LPGGQRLALGPRLQALLRYVPPAVLAALIAPEIFVRDGLVDLSLLSARPLAALVAALVALYTRSVSLTIAAGLLALWLAQHFLH